MLLHNHRKREILFSLNNRDWKSMTSQTFNSLLWSYQQASESEFRFLISIRNTLTSIFFLHFFKVMSIFFWRSRVLSCSIYIWKLLENLPRIFFKVHFIVYEPNLLCEVNDFSFWDYVTSFHFAVLWKIHFYDLAQFGNHLFCSLLHEKRKKQKLTQSISSGYSFYFSLFLSVFRVLSNIKSFVKW